MPNIHYRSLGGRLAEMRAHLATEHCASHTAQLHLARWRTTPVAAAASSTASPMPASQASWHAQAQQHFCAWLTEGGFLRAEPTSAGRPDASAALADSACQQNNND